MLSHMDNMISKDSISYSTTKFDIVSTLNDTLFKLCSDISRFVENPDKDFTRSRKLPVTVLMQFMLNMEGNSLNSEIYNNFPDRNRRMTASALVQQRNKLKPEAPEF